MKIWTLSQSSTFDLARIVKLLHHNTVQSAAAYNLTDQWEASSSSLFPLSLSSEGGPVKQ